MHPNLETLLQIQDLKSQRGELMAEGAAERRVEEEEFLVDVEHALALIDAKLEELEAELPATIRNRYERLASGRGRAVVPVINGICYGCFVSIPTSITAEVVQHSELRTCDNCGRFLYGFG